MNGLYFVVLEMTDGWKERGMHIYMHTAKAGLRFLSMYVRGGGFERRKSSKGYNLDYASLASQDKSTT